MITFELIKELRLHALDKCAERLHFCPKKKISKLGIGKEDDEKHDGKSQDIFSTSAECGGQLSHRLIETDVLENLSERKYNLIIAELYKSYN